MVIEMFLNEFKLQLGLWRMIPSLEKKRVLPKPMQLTFSPSVSNRWANNSERRGAAPDAAHISLVVAWSYAREDFH